MKNIDWDIRTSKFSPINNWINKRKRLPHYDYLKKVKPSFELGYFLSLDICTPLYNIKNIKNEVFKETWKKSYTYLKNAYAIVEEFEEPYAVEKYIIGIDNEIAYDIVEQLGPPPNPTYPIYIITIGSGINEKVVYIGKTSVNAKSRFNGGHSAALKLHHPDYEKYKKTYM
ncbi:hypothetical protein [Bacillus wiedmannii]|uniref:hypothetical protein n=1 Tax=Bacillus wiedmannii TaxID=1890302 RepID=UPI0021CEAF8C|nr:hypothetical protein [Bacillus wiedmannii]MCU5330689.1 hypothetical protein [Bacillus wiedmannii]